MLGHLTYIGLSISPVGCILGSIPFGLLQMKYPAWLVILTTPPLAYVQVIAIDLLWDTLDRWPWFRATLDKKRSARVERMLATKGAFWPTLLATPVIGAWVVMAFMRYAQVPHRRVALPIFVSLSCVSTIFVALWTYAPAIVQGQTAP